MHARTLSESAQAALAELGKSKILSKCYLAGGSALALRLGHRKSFDFDFYTRSNFSAENVAVELSKIGKFETTLLEPPYTLLGIFNGVKFSLFLYDYPLIGVTANYQTVRVAGLEDIAAMKLSAIAGRATKRDYIDIYVISISTSLEQQLEWYHKKFGKLGNNLYVTIKALGYFDDAEDDDMPIMITKISWEEVKKFLSSESQRLARKLI